MKKATQKIVSILLSMLTVLFVVPTAVFAAAHPGTAQVPKYEESSLHPLIDPGIHFQTMTEDGREFPVYCFSSSLLWPDSAPHADTTKYVPDAFNHLPDTVKDKLYRVLYAGYPHNNAGLYVESSTPFSASAADIRHAFSEMKTLLTTGSTKTDFEYAAANGYTGIQSLYTAALVHGWDSFTFFDDGSGTLNDFSTPQMQALCDASTDFMILGLLEDPLYEEVRQNHQAVYALFYGVDSIYSLYTGYGPDILDETNLQDQFTLGYGYHGAVAPDQARAATQYAIWRVLYEANINYGEANIPNNHKDVASMMAEGSLVKKLVDFANTSTLKVPQRGTDIAQMEAHRDVFATGEFLLDKNNAKINTRPIEFTKNLADGKYYSELLHFSPDAYTLPYTISLLDASNNVIASIVNHGEEEFRLITNTLPVGAKVDAISENNWASDVYQYVRNAPDKAQYQELSGVYYYHGEVPLKMEVGAKIVSTSFAVEKTVNNDNVPADTEYWFKAYVDLETESGTQMVADIPYEKYNTTTNTVTSHGTVHHFSDGYVRFFLKANEGIRFKELPNGTQYTVEEYAVNDENGTMPTIWKTPVYTPSATGTTSTSPSVVKVQNEYVYSPVAISLNSSKTLKEGSTDKLFAAEDFSFILWPDEHGYPMPDSATYNSSTNRVDLIVQNDALGAISFGKIKYTIPGTYRYTIEEMQVTKPYISRDPHHFDIKVVVTDTGDADHHLQANVTIEKHDTGHTALSTDTYTYTGLTENIITAGPFNNIYDEAKIQKVIRVKKSIKNTSSDLAFPRENYVFHITPSTPTDLIAPNFYGTSSKSAIIKTGASGEADSPVLEFNNSWFTTHAGLAGQIILTYDITEDEVSSIAASAFHDGLTFDNQTAQAIITITKDTTNGFNAEIKYDYKDESGATQTTATPAVFTNTYSAAPVSTTFTIDKGFATAYTPTTGEQYEFKINDNFGRNGDKSGYTVAGDKKIKLTWNGSSWVSLGNSITFVKPGEYRFEFAEIPDATNHSMTYDTTKWFVDYKVIDNGHGALVVEPGKYFHESATSTITDKATFVNKYTSTVTTDIPISKNIVGRAWNDTESYSALIVHGQTTIGNTAFDPLLDTNICHSHADVVHSMEVEFIKTAPGNNVLATFHQEGDYYFRIQERNTGDESDLITDPTTYIVKVRVEKPVNDLVVTAKEIYKVANTWSNAVSASAVEFNNKYTELTVSKNVIGGGDTSKHFAFTVTLSDNTINGNYGNMTFVDGVANFTLAHGNSIKAVRLPVGITYKVKEATVYNYNTTSTKAIGTIATGAIESVFTNKYSPSYDEPDDDKPILSANTADNTRIELWTLLFTIGASAIVVFLKRNKYSTR